MSMNNYKIPIAPLFIIPKISAGKIPQAQMCFDRRQDKTLCSVYSPLELQHCVERGGVCFAHNHIPAPKTMPRTYNPVI
jgi:hypothetical protein